MQNWEPKRVDQYDPGAPCEHQQGWLFPILLQLDALTNRRWAWWEEQTWNGELDGTPIPHLHFLHTPDPRAVKMFNRCIDVLKQKTGMHHREAFLYLIEWLHASLVKHTPLPAKEKANKILYQFFCIDVLLVSPFDYLGHFLAELSYGKGNAFYPTPMSLCTMMARLTFGNGDCRYQSWNDPCIGTGRTMLVASNHCLELTAQDIDATMIKCSVINGYLYAPWFVSPRPWLLGRGEEPEMVRQMRLNEERA